MPEPIAPEEIATWRRRLGSGANNRAWALSEQRARTPAEDDELLDAAHAARWLWEGVGDARNRALADLLLGHVHGLLGLGPTGLRYARAARAYFDGVTAAPWEEALLHGALASAAAAASDRALHAESLGRALAIAEAMADPEDRAIVMATLEVVPRMG